MQRVLLDVRKLDSESRKTRGVDCIEHVDTGELPNCM